MSATTLLRYLIETGHTNPRVFEDPTVCRQCWCRKCGTPGTHDWMTHRHRRKDDPK